MRTYGTAGYVVAARGTVDIPLAPRPITSRPPHAPVIQLADPEPSTPPPSPPPAPAATTPSRPGRRNVTLARQRLAAGATAGPRGGAVHGTAGYSAGCRCQVCVEAKRDYGRRYRAARQERS
ncbi:hypothetical protein [Mycobacterium sp.]|uniref:hypothetical protein n=1 Tax=Mycobacterium sp. TaxID=1785 RepID=UPI002BC7D7DD|nr:hypothetical protein [Mycobacterium sp.]HTY35382.1 hypothetical protein [Mycobacterium sp.]